MSSEFGSRWHSNKAAARFTDTAADSRLIAVCHCCISSDLRCTRTLWSCLFRSRCNSKSTTLHRCDALLHVSSRCKVLWHDAVYRFRLAPRPRLQLHSRRVTASPLPPLQLCSECMHAGCSSCSHRAERYPIRMLCMLLPLHRRPLPPLSPRRSLPLPRQHAAHLQCIPSSDRRSCRKLACAMRLVTLRIPISFNLPSRYLSVTPSACQNARIASQSKKCRSLCAMFVCLVCLGIHRALLVTESGRACGRR